jgi:exosortase
MSDTVGKVGAWGLAIVGFALLYAQVLSRLVSDWATDDNYSHGFIILPFAIFFAWERRGRLARAGGAPSLAGLGVVACGLALLVVGQLGAELFLSRVSLLFVLAGTIVYLRGWAAFRVLAFPLGFLILMVPIPSIIFNRVAFPLQLLASKVGESALAALHIPVLREGNLIVLAHTTLEVAEACSGIRSLISLVTLGLIYGYFTDPRTGVRAVIALSTVPIAIVANGVRVAGTGIAAQYYGDVAAQGFLHTFSGWLMFLAAFVMLFAVTSLLMRCIPPPRESTPSASVAAA